MLDPDEELARIFGMSKKELTAAFDAEGEVIHDDDDNEADKRGIADTLNDTGEYERTE